MNKSTQNWLNTAFCYKPKNAITRINPKKVNKSKIKSKARLRFWDSHKLGQAICDGSGWYVQQ